MRLPILCATLAVVACSDAPPPYAGDTAVSLSPPPPGVLAASLDTSLEPGERSQLVVAGANPGERVFLVFGFQGEGQGPCPPPLAGGCLGVRNAQLLAERNADADGIATFPLNVPGSASVGAALSTQAVVLRGGNSVLSNVRTDEVGPRRAVNLPTGGSAVAVAPSGVGVMVNRTAGSVSVQDLDLVGNGGTERAQLDVDGRPWSVVLSNDGETAYVALRGTSEVVRISDLSGTPTLDAARAPVDGEPTAIAISPNGNTLYAANWTAGTVSVIDADSMEVFDTVDLNDALAGSGLLGGSVTPGPAGPGAPVRARRDQRR
jgi:YVTN family beta-propeller protein